LTVFRARFGSKKSSISCPFLAKKRARFRARFWPQKVLDFPPSRGPPGVQEIDTFWPPHPARGPPGCWWGHLVWIAAMGGWVPEASGTQPGAPTRSRGPPGTGGGRQSTARCCIAAECGTSSGPPGPPELVSVRDLGITHGARAIIDLRSTTLLSPASRAPTVDSNFFTLASSRRRAKKIRRARLEIRSPDRPRAGTIDEHIDQPGIS